MTKVVIETQAVMKLDSGENWNAIKVTKGTRKSFCIAGESSTASDGEFSLHHAIKRIRELERKLSACSKKLVSAESRLAND